MPEKIFHPAFLVVSGRLKKMEREMGIQFWDDRDPKFKDREGTPTSYIFQKTRHCNVKLGNLKVIKRVNTFHLVDNGKKVAIAEVNYFHKSYADVEVETFEPHRRKGYATILFGWVSDWLTKQGFIHESTCDVNNKASIRMHDKLGFQIVGHIRWAKKEK